MSTSAEKRVAETLTATEDAAPMPTSTVITKQFADMSWPESSLLIPHEPLRMYFARFNKITEAGIDSKWKASLFFQNFETFYQVVHHHHDAEEKVFFPFLQTKANMPEKCQAQHADLMKQLDEVLAFKAKFEALTPDDKSFGELSGELNTLFSKLRTDMEAHLAEEERIVPAILAEHFTKAEHDAMVDTIIKSAGLTGNKVFLPMILWSMERWGGTRAMAEFLPMLPAPIKLMNHMWWTPAHLSNFEANMLAMERNEEPTGSAQCSVM